MLFFNIFCIDKIIIPATKSTQLYGVININHCSERCFSLFMYLFCNNTCSFLIF